MTFRITGRQACFIVAIVVLVLVLDIFSKAWVVHNIINIANGPSHYPYGGIGVFKDFGGVEFSVGHLHNTGAAWGLFREYAGVLLILRCLFVAALVCYLLFLNPHKNCMYPIVFVIAGAIGNIIDFFWYGYVVDMFHFIFWGYDYPLFNVADISICIGMVWLILITVFGKEKKCG